MADLHVKYKVHYKLKGDDRMRHCFQYLYGEGKQAQAEKLTKNQARGRGDKIEIFPDPEVSKVQPAQS